MYDWENLRYFLAVARIGTLSGASRELKVDHATVSRRLSALEEELHARLVDRLPRACRLTPIGKRVFDLASGMEEGAYAIERFARSSQSPVSGKVTLSAPPVLVANVLAKHLAQFRRANPGLQLSVSGEAQQVSLSRREADVALRLVRPKEPSSVARKLGRMPFALYASQEYAFLHSPSQWEFIAYDARFDDMPQQKWLLAIAGDRPVACQMSDITGHLAAAKSGAGVAGLPTFLGDADASLQRLSHTGPAFSRDIWLVVHRDLKKVAPVRAVMDFLVAVLAERRGTASLSAGLLSTA
jgi:DNA-binding transcriptional LysR family regulator